MVNHEIGSDNMMLDVTGIWNASWMKYLKSDFDTKLYKIIGDSTFPSDFDNPEFDFHGSGFAVVKYKDQPIVFYRKYSEYSGIHTWAFTKPEARQVLKDLLKRLLELEREAKQMHIWGIKDIDLEKLDVSNFVSPEYVENIFEHEVYPQLEEEIFNHILLFSYPGVGKTAFCRYLAKNHPDWQTVVVVPSVIEKPKHIVAAFDYAIYREPAILIFEDVDTWAQTRFREASLKEDFSPFLGALLNCVDGMESHQKLLVIATTNNPASLDPAIVRPGRFGIQVEFRYTHDELVRVCNNYLGLKKGKTFYKPVIRNTPAHLRALMKTVRAFAKLKKQDITQPLLLDINKLLKTEPKLPSLDDMFVAEMPDAPTEDKSYG
jgi:hypothetical protein